MTQTTLPHEHCKSSADLCSHMPETSEFQIVSDVFKQLGDATRIRIFWILCHCEECVLNISAMMEMSSPAVSHHLKLLKSGGLITSRREGKEVYYKAVNTKQAQLLHHMIEKMVEITCPDTQMTELPDVSQ